MSYIVKFPTRTTLSIIGTAVNSFRTIRIINVSRRGYEKWRMGMPIYEALPNLSIDDANFLVHGYDCEAISQLNVEL